MKYKTCSNGHYYDATLAACPYCASNSKQKGASGETVDSDFGTKPGGSAASGKTRPNSDYQGGGQNIGKTRPAGDFRGDGQNIGKTRPFDSNMNMNGEDPDKTRPLYEEDDTNDEYNYMNAPEEGSDHTEFFDEKSHVENGQEKREQVYRSKRKLVGWLISYTLDPVGVDFRIYEGKNSIGRDVRNQITIPESTVSGQHAMIRYLDGKFAIKDEMSSHGTYVNGENIELNAVYLKDGDMIQVGQTMLKFRTAL